MTVRTSVNNISKYIWFIHFFIFRHSDMVLTDVSHRVLKGILANALIWLNLYQLQTYRLSLTYFSRDGNTPENSAVTTKIHPQEHRHTNQSLTKQEEKGTDRNDHYQQIHRFTPKQSVHRHIKNSIIIPTSRRKKNKKSGALLSSDSYTSNHKYTSNL